MRFDDVEPSPAIGVPQPSMRVLWAVVVGGRRRPLGRPATNEVEVRRQEPRHRIPDDPDFDPTTIVELVYLLHQPGVAHVQEGKLRSHCIEH